LVERIILLVDRKQQTKTGKRYADAVEIDHERKQLMGCSIKLIVRCRLDSQLMWKSPVRLRKNSDSGFKFSDLVQISKANRMKAEDKSKNAARQTLKSFPFSPLYICHAAFISLLNLRAVGGEKVRTRFGEIQSHAGDLRLRNTPLLSSARRSQRTFKFDQCIVIVVCDDAGR
jgi:hypothetical protein